jgi:predicted RNA polymerase sigma factor
VRWLRDAGLAHDVAQDALAQALQQQPVRHLRGWLAAVNEVPRRRPCAATNASGPCVKRAQRALVANDSE